MTADDAHATRNRKAPQHRGGDGTAHRRNRTFRQQAGVFGEDVRALARAAGDTAVGKLDPILDYVRDKPLKSLLVAAGAGAILAMIFSRR